MATVSSLSAPGVEVREYDESLRITSNTGTTVLVPGFAAQGPVEEILTISSIEDFETIYGIPTNAAERYFYYTCLAVLNNSGPGTTLLTSRLCYGKDDGDNVSNAYTLLAYPAIPYVKNTANKKGYSYYKPAIEKQLWLADEKAPIKTVVTNLEIVSTTGNAELAGKIKIAGFEYAADSSLPTFLASDIDEAHKLNLVFHVDGETNENGSLTKFTTPLDVYTELCENPIKGLGGNGVRIELAGQIKVGDKVFGYISATVESSASEGMITAFGSGTANFSGQKFVATLNAEDAIPLGDIIKAYDKATSLDVDSDDVTYLIGAPATFNVSLSEYYNILANDLFAWKKDYNTFADNGDFGTDLVSTLGKAAFIIINTSRGTINASFEGHYFGITDNLFNEPCDDYALNACRSVKFTTWNKKENNEGNNGKNDGIVDKQTGVDNFTNIDETRLDFHLASNNRGSISNVLQTSTSSFDVTGREFDDTLNIGLFKLKKSSVGTESMKLTYSTVEKYNASFGKSRTYSISNATTPHPYFIENILENSKNIKVMVNPHIANKIHIDIKGELRGKVRVFSTKLLDTYRKYQDKYLTSAVPASLAKITDLSKRVTHNRLNIENWKTLVSRVGITVDLLEEIAANENDSYNLFNKCDSLYPFATYSTPKDNNKIIGAVPSKVTRCLNLVANDEEYPDVDIICEGGLGTIYTYANAKVLVSEGSDSLINGFVNDGATKPLVFNDDAILQGIEDLRTSRTSLTMEATDVLEDYMAVQNAFLGLANSFQNGGRGDTFYIPDVLRGILIRGKDTKVEKLFGTELTNNAYGDGEKVNHSWSTSIYSPIKHLVESLTTSYASIYAQFFKILDGFTNEKHWVPASGYMAALMCASDQLQGPWYAGAGLNRGLVQGVLDCAVNPNQKQRGDLYKLCVNSVPKIANIGVTCWGIRTLSKKASAFDQNTCRRTFLFMEKAIKKLLRYFLFEPNTTYTQLSIYNEIEPYMESIKNQGGIYSYQVRCDSSNNTPEIVNAGNLAVDVSAAPTRTAEFIVLNMTANKYTQEVSSSEFSI